MIILNAEPRGYSEEGRNILREVGELREVECDRAELLRQIGDADVLVVRLGHRIDDEVLEHAHRLRYIVTATTGLNHIDLVSATARNVEVLSLRGEREFLEGLTATAELTWGLLLNLVRRIPAAHSHVVAGEWDRNRFQGVQLKDKVLGVVGFGRLGRVVAEYGKAFRMKVLAADPYMSDVPSWVEHLTLEELLPRSDVVSLHVNLDERTSGFFDRRAFELMKPGALFLNTSRGELVEEVGLLDSLVSGKLAGAALDVLVGEAEKQPGWPKNSQVWQYASRNDNLLLTPHIGGLTDESLSRAEVFMANKLKQHIRG